MRNELLDLIRVRIMVGVEVRVRPRSEICKLRMRDIEIAQRILQIVQIAKSRATLVLSVYLVAYIIFVLLQQADVGADYFYLSAPVVTVNL